MCCLFFFSVEYASGGRPVTESSCAVGGRFGEEQVRCYGESGVRRRRRMRREVTRSEVCHVY